MSLIIPVMIPTTSRCFLHTLLIPTAVPGRIIFKNQGFLRPLCWCNAIIRWKDLDFIPWDRVLLQPRLALNSWSSCFCRESTEFTHMHHHGRQNCFFSLTTSDYDGHWWPSGRQKARFLECDYIWEPWASTDNHSWEPFAVLRFQWRPPTLNARIWSDLLWTKSPWSLALWSTALGCSTLPLLQCSSPWRPVLRMDRVVTSDTGLLRSWFVFLSTFKALKALYRRSNLTPHPEFAHLWLQARNLNLTKLQGQDSILNPGNPILWMWGPGVLGAILGVGTVAQWKSTWPRLGYSGSWAQSLA